MLTPRIKFVNFQISKNKKIKILSNFFKIKNLISKYKFLISLTPFYKYGYSNKLEIRRSEFLFIEQRRSELKHMFEKQLDV